MKKALKKQSGRKQKSFALEADVCVRTLHQLVRRDLEKQDICLSPNVHSYIRKHQVDVLLKKYIFSGKQEGLEQKAFDKFLSVNERLKKVVIPELGPRVSRFKSTHHNVLLLARRYVREILGDVSWEDIFLTARHSGGTSLGVSYADTSIENKFSLPMTATENVTEIFNNYLNYNTLLQLSLERSNDLRGNPPWYDIVKSSRATTVPKSSDIDRMIAIEPTANMYLQQGIMHVMYNRLRSVGLDVTTLPERHKVLAQESSISKQNSTVDFSSASDSISLQLVEALLPKQWLDKILAVRCSSMTINGQDVRLQMVSTMGNATTFPLETVVFYAIGLACHHLLNGKTADGNFPYLQKYKNCISVFGDDCIIPTDTTPLFIEMCELSGLIVNVEKTFMGENPFRESCGGDYLHGVDVRPVMLTRPTTSSKSAYQAWLYNIFNAVNKKYIQYFGELRYIYNKHAIRYLLKKITLINKYPFLVPEDFPSDSGIHSTDTIRLERCYGLTFNRLKVDEQNVIRFNYLKFQYWDNRQTSDDLRYCVELKHWGTEQVQQFWHSYLADPLREQELFYNTRKRGGYVVAKSRTVHWSPRQ